MYWQNNSKTYCDGLYMKGKKERLQDEFLGPGLNTECSFKEARGYK